MNGMRNTEHRRHVFLDSAIDQEDKETNELTPNLPHK